MSGTQRSTDRPLRIAQVAARLPVGGMEMVVANLVHHLPAARFESDVWCLDEADQLGDELRREGVRLIELHKRPGRDPRLFFRLARLLRQQATDIVHCHDELSWFYAAVGARLAGVSAVIMTMHGRRPNISPRHLLEQRILARLTNRVVSVSAFLGRQLVEEGRLPERKIELIRNGIPFDAQPPNANDRRFARTYLQLQEDDLIVGCVGELSPVKNLDLLLEAVAAARSKGAPLRLVLIGDGRERNHLGNKVAALDMQDAVVFSGIQRNVPRLLPAFDIYACSSKYEGISLSILEAMASERPIVATRVGGNSELLEDGRTGVLVNPQDVGGLSHGLVRLAGDDTARRTLGKAAREAVRQRYTIDGMIENYAGLYERVTARVPLPSTRNAA